MSKVTMSTFGRMGRFGNQIFQYVFLKVYCKLHGCQLEIPRWCGHELFGHTEPPVSEKVPFYREGQYEDRPMGRHVPPVGDEIVGHDWCGYAQYHTSWYAPHQGFILSLFQPTETARARVQDAYAKLRRVGKTLVGMHVRRSDYGRLLYPRVPVDWYLAELHRMWPRLEEPVLFYCSENMNLVGEFVRYDPVTAEELGVKTLEQAQPGYRDLDEHYRMKTRSMDPWPDWYLLSQCDVLLMPPSTYSFTAAMLGNQGKTVWRARAGFGGFELIDPWNSDPMPAEWCEDFREIPGLCLDHNPPHYWRCTVCRGLQGMPNGEKCPNCGGAGTVNRPTKEWTERWKGIKC